MNQTKQKRITQSLSLFLAGALVGLGAYLLQQQLTKPTPQPIPDDLTAQAADPDKEERIEIVNGRLDITVTSDGLSAKNINIPQGTTVTWINQTDQPIQIAHTPDKTSDEPTFASPVLEPGQAYAYQFKTTGTFNYQDLLNIERSGRVQVEANKE